MQVPPTCFRSMRTVRMPASASAVDSGVPACPEPMMMASDCCGVITMLVIARAPGQPPLLCENAESGNSTADQDRLQRGLLELQSLHREPEDGAPVVP